MSDRYSQLVRLPVAGGLAKRVGLPQPVTLDRYSAGDPLVRGRVLLGGAGRVAEAAARVLAAAGVDAATALDDPVRAHAAAAGLDAAVFNPDAPADQRFKALIFDATGITSSAELVELQRFFYPTVRRVLPSGRVIVIGGGRRALEGFTRSLGKEIGRGATVNLVHVEAGAEDQIGPTLRFFLSPRSAYVSGQVAHVGPGAEAPLAGRTALVTGASRGIGASIASVLEREGASVVRLDLKDADLELDITADDAPEVLAERFSGGLDVLVHNAGVTKDRTLAKMPEDRWQSLMKVNLLAPERITEALLPRLSDDGRIVCVSSMSAIAGNSGQTNYATSKAGLLDLVSSLDLERQITINAVAPGFIETQMTASMPIAVREAGRRMNSLRQGGLPVDVAETVAWLAASGLERNVIRVCGQSLLGA
jgi:3-oxoacyl-[acyl-carrier protein] reductase